MKCGVDVTTHINAPRGMEQSIRRVLCSFPSAAASENGTSFEVASCFRWRGKFVAASVLSNRTGKPLPCHKLSAIHVHRRIVATTSCGKYLSRLFIALHLPQLLYVDTISVIQYSIAQVELGFVAPTILF